MDVVVTGRGALRFETIHANIGLYRMTSATAIRLPQKAMQYGGRGTGPHFSTPYRLLTEVELAYVVRLRRHSTAMAMFNKVSRRGAQVTYLSASKATFSLLIGSSDIEVLSALVSER